MSDSEFTFTKPAWKVTQDKKVYETPIFNLHQKIMTPSGPQKAGTFYILDAPEWINVIALTPDRDIILVEQFRYGIEKCTLEIPGGMVDPGETPLESAMRELAEETGFTSQKWTKLGEVSSNPAIMTNFTHLYLAEECIQSEAQNTGEHEDILVHTIPVDEFLQLVKSGVIHHAIVLSAVSQLLLKGK
jgi:8-oxo-dGTP pyrophosphatase MutT (NUDIX family)